MTAPHLARTSGMNIIVSCSSRQITASASRTLQRSSIHTKRKLHGTIVPDQYVQKRMIIQSQPSFHDYFSANTSIDRGWIKNGLLAAFRTTAEKQKKPLGKKKQDSHQYRAQVPDRNPSIKSVTPPYNSATDVNVDELDGNVVVSTGGLAQEHDGILPHRRRKRKAAQDGIAANESQSSKDQEQLPLDASSQLTTAAAALPTSAVVRRKFATYLSLTKPRLSFLIILTTASAYSLYPIPDILSDATQAADASSTLSTSTLTLAFLTLGTFLSSASANTFNMLFEPKYDALMSRTRNRPLVRKLISQRAALAFGLFCGGSGLVLLYLGTNPTVTALSALNIFLYAGVYTPMKRLSPANTWVGAVVGAIPPLMGWFAAAGEVATSEHHSWRDLMLSEDAIGGWLLAALLFAWQFPHFNSLSHTIREDYRNAGHRMLAWMNPAMNARVALRYSVLMFPICAGLYSAGVVNEGFLVISTACNAWMLKEAVRFYKNQGAGGSARGLFWASVWQLPLVLVGALVCKTGIWSGFFDNEPTSIYDDSDAEIASDGQGLSMESMTEKQQQQPSTHNMAMMGFKRPS